MTQRKAPKKDQNLSEEEKNRKRHMLANDTEIFLKCFKFLCIYKNHCHLKSSDFSNKCKKVFEGISEQTKLGLCFKI